MKRKRNAFTLVEILVTLGILVILIGMLLPTFESLQHKMRLYTCMQNHRNLVNGYIQYMADHQGHLLGSSTYYSADHATLLDSPAISWVGTGNTLDSLRKGALWPYIGDEKVYKCPESVGWQGKNYLRSYSAPAQLDGQDWRGLIQVGGLSGVPNASQTLVFLDEYDPRGYLMGSFVLYDVPSLKTFPDGTSWYSKWVDYPAIWHGDGIPLSFMDGHVEFYKFVDPTTAQKPQDYTSPTSNGGYFWESSYGTDPPLHRSNHSDLYRMQQYTIPTCWYKLVNYNQ